MNDTNVRVVNFFKKEAPLIDHQRTVKQKRKSPVDYKDIFEINNKILALLEGEASQLLQLKNKASKLQWITEHSDNAIERQVASRELKKITMQIELIDSGYREAKYIYSTDHILKEYAQLLNQPVKISFMKKEKRTDDDRKQILVTEFLNIAKNYLPIKPFEGQQKMLVCEDCCTDLQREDDFLFVCPLCGFAVKHFATTSSYQENNRINVAQRYVYDKRAHFGDSIKKFQAKQNTTISQTIYNDLWEKLESHDIPIEKLTKDHLYEFLKLTGHSDHYEDITLIYCEMTGEKAPDISHLEQRLFSLFDEIDPIYERIKPNGRVNFLNGQFVLFKLLQKLNYPCKEEDFYILKTREKMLEHDQIWKKICGELAWTFQPTL